MKHRKIFLEALIQSKQYKHMFGLGPVLLFRRFSPFSVLGFFFAFAQSNLNVIVNALDNWDQLSHTPNDENVSEKWGWKRKKDKSVKEIRKSREKSERYKNKEHKEEREKVVWICFFNLQV